MATQIHLNEGARNTVKGTLNQAKGVARERWGQVTHNPKLQVAGKKDQVIGTLQKSVGNSWAFRNRTPVLALTGIAVVAAAVFYFVNRAAQATNPDDQYLSYNS